MSGRVVNVLGRVEAGGRVAAWPHIRRGDVDGAVTPGALHAVSWKA